MCKIMKYSNLGVSKPVLVGDVVGDTSLASRLSTCSTRLQVELLTSLLEGRKTFLSPSWQINMDRSSHASSKIGGTGVKISVLGIQHEVLARFSLDRVLDCLDATSKSLKNSFDISTLLHGDNPQLILFIHPDLKEGINDINTKKIQDNLQGRFCPCCGRYLYPQASPSPFLQLGGFCHQT